MALTKSIDTAVGVAAVYWRLTERRDNYDAREIQCILSGYVSEGARRAGKAPLEERVILIALAEGQAFDEFSMARLYAASKAFAPRIPATPAIVDGERVMVTPPAPPAIFDGASDT